MDKRFLAIIISLLSVGFLIFSWPILNPELEEGGESITAGSFSTAYVDRFFKKDKVIDIQITLSEADYADMLENPTKEEYKEAAVILDGEKVEHVGLRIKGNSSLRSVAGSDSDRYSFKIDFDQYIAKQSLEGLTKLNLNNSFSDPSYLREYLSYDLLEQMNVPVPAFCYANIYINGDLVGLYLAVEGIEKPLAQRYYGPNYGTIYKPYGERGKGNDLVYLDDQRDSYSGLQAVTKEKDGSAEALVTMIRMLNQGRDLEKYLDVQEILRYFAVNTVLVNLDSYQGQFTHNYYLYEEDGVFAILPWDYNMSFGGFSMGRGSGQGQTSLDIDQPVSGTTLAERPLLGKLLEVEKYKDLYHQYLEELINGPFTLEKMTVEITRVANLIRPHLEKDPTKFYTMEQFEQAIAPTTAQEVISAGSAADPNTTDNTKIDVQNRNPVSEQTPKQSNKSRQPAEDFPWPPGEGQIPNLLEFVSKRSSNVALQLSGELPAEGEEEQANNPGDGQQGVFPQGEHPQREKWDDRQGARMVPEGMIAAEGMIPPEGINRRPDMAGQDFAHNGESRNFPHGMAKNSGNVPQGSDPQQIFLIGGAILALSIAVLIIFRLKTKHMV